MPSWLKRGVRAALSTQSPPDNGMAQREQARRLVLSDLHAYLPASKINNSPANGSLSANQTQPPFENFYARFNKAVQNSDPWLSELERDYPALFSVAVKTREYLEACNNLSAPVDGVFRRLFFQNIPYMNNKKTHELLNYKNSLPRVGLLYYPNPEPRDFLVDTLEGKYNIDDMEFGELLSRVWQGRECDFELYQQCLQEEVEKALSALPEDFWQYYPDKQWLIDETCQHAQYQMAFKKLLDERHWDLLFVGAMESSVGQTLFDCFESCRTPVIYFHHAYMFGDPFQNLFSNADKYLATGKVAEEHFQQLGISEDRIVKIGSINRECFPSRESLTDEYKSMRRRFSIPDESVAIIYGLTMDIYLYKKRTCEELTELMLDSFEKLVSDLGVVGPYLFLKYHPSPRTDPYFSFSRQQMPLERFFERLTPLGFQIRLIKELEPYLKAGDCFIAHESTTIWAALEAGCPTLSLNLHEGKADPLLGWDTYAGKLSAHKLLPDSRPADEIARAIKDVATCPKDLAHKESFQVWNGIFDCGRTESLTRLIKTVDELLTQESRTVQAS